jgi:hypothetical protein
MNKLLAITSGLLVAGSAAAEFTPPTLNVDAKVQFDTAYVSEGRRIADQIFAPSAEIGLPLFNDAAELYFGVDAYLKVNDKKRNEMSDAIFGNKVSPYIGFSYDITDIFTVDLWYTLNRIGKKPEIRSLNGYNIASVVSAAPALPAGAAAVDSVIAHNGTTTAIAGTFDAALNRVYAIDLAAVEQALRTQQSPTGKKQSHEIGFGILADVLLDPALYFSYDFTQKKANVEGTIGHTFDLGSVGANGLAIDLGAKLGYSRVKKPFGINSKTKVLRVWEDTSVNPHTLKHEVGELFGKKGWFYTGANADLVYSLNEHAKARAGVAFSYNNAGKDTWVNAFNRKKHSVWFSSALEFSF